MKGDKKVVRHVGGKEYKYLYVTKATDPRIGKTINGYKVTLQKKGGYEYGQYKKKSPTLVGKSGKVYQKRVEELIENAPDRTTEYDIKARIANWIKYHKGERLTVKTLKSITEQSRYGKYFINAGYDIEKAANELGTTVEELKNKDNWDGSRITINGKTWELNWSNYKSTPFRLVPKKKKEELGG